MFPTYGWRLITLCLFFYIFSCLATCITTTVPGESALPVSINIKGSSNKNLDDIDVYRLSMNGGQRLLTVKTYDSPSSIIIKDALAKSYFQAIQLKLTDQQISTLISVTVRIGNKTFSSSRQQLLSTWALVRQSPHQRLYQSPNFISAERSALPFWRKVINWGFEWNLIWDIFIHKIPLLLLILIFLRLSKRSDDNLTSSIQFWLAGKSRQLIYISGGLGVLITLYRMPYIIWPIDSGLDPSWVVGLNWAFTKGLHWGQDIVFTYGPYYWLLYPNLVLNSSMLLISFSLTTLVYIYTISVFLYYIIYLVQQKKLSILVAAMGISVLALYEYTLNDLVIVSIVLLLAMSKQRSYFVNILPACFLLALLSLCKFSYLTVSFCLILFYTGQCIIKKKYTDLLLTALTFTGCLCSLWVISGQPISDLGLFIARAFSIAQGYSEAMATPIWNEAQSVLVNILINMSLLGISILLLLGVVFVFFIAMRQNSFWFEILLTAPILFLAFKEGFVRMDLSHIIQFFAQLQIILVAYLIFYANQKTQSSYIRFILIISFVVLLPITNAHIPSFNKPEWKGLYNSNYREKLLTDSKRRLQKAYPLNQNIRTAIGNSSVDIIPYDISLLYGYGLRWNPRLIFQSYCVFSPALDSLNLGHIVGDSAPDQLLFSFKSIDDRYPLFDEPALIRGIISRYDTIKSSANTYLLLQQKTRKTTSKPFVVLQSYKFGSINRVINIPVRMGYYTYVHAQIELTLLGKILNFLLKIQPLFIDISLNDNSRPQQFRLIRETAEDGLLVSSFAENLQMASVILSGKAQANVKSIKFVGNPWLYNPNIKVKFRFETLHE